MEDFRVSTACRRSLANEKLLTALITLLAAREDGLLDELTVIFRLAQATSGLNRHSTDRLWDDINSQLRLITRLAHAEAPLH